MGHLDLVQRLLDAQALVDQARSHEVTPLYIAAQSGHATVVHCLLRARADVNRRTELGTTALYIAAQENHVEALQHLLEASADGSLPLGATGPWARRRGARAAAPRRCTSPRRTATWTR